MKRHRMALLMILGAYPAVVVILALLPHSFATMHMALKPLMIVPFIVLWMVYVVSPVISRYCGQWVGAKH